MSRILLLEGEPVLREQPGRLPYAAKCLHAY